MSILSTHTIQSFTESGEGVTSSIPQFPAHPLSIEGINFSASWGWEMGDGRCLKYILITHYLLPITHYPLPITHYLLPITHYPLPITPYLRTRLNPVHPIVI